MVFPFLKLGALAVKTLSKPLANAIKRRAKSHPRFRGTIINFAQSYHKMNVGMQRRLYGYSTNVDIKPLIEEKAVETAADLVGEILVFGVAGAVVVAEYTRSTISESRKEEKRRQEKEALRQKDLELERELQMLKERLDALETAASDSWLPRILRGSALSLGSSGGGGRSTGSSSNSSGEPAHGKGGVGSKDGEKSEEHDHDHAHEHGSEHEHEHEHERTHDGSGGENGEGEGAPKKR